MHDQLPLEDMLTAKAIATIRHITQGSCTLVYCEYGTRFHFPLTEREKVEDDVELTPEQLAILRAILLDNRSYFHPNRVYRRNPPRTYVAFELRSPHDLFHVFVDPQNLGWAMFLNGALEHTHWCTTGRIQELIKSIYPQRASQHHGSMWNKEFSRHVYRLTTSPP